MCMEPSDNRELEVRVNHAYSLLQEAVPYSQIAERLSRKYGISKVQAYNYLQQAREKEKHVPVPEKSVNFTVKLPLSLIEHLTAYAETMKMPVRDAISLALKDFLAGKNTGEIKQAS